MTTLSLLQHYWWFIISLLGALLVFLMFVQGGQSLLYSIGRTCEQREMVASALGRKWELTFTTLVTFGGAFFASFPLFYSTSFGGAYYVWFTILFVFVIQAVADYRNVCLGLAVMLLSQLTALHFFINNIDDEDLCRRAARRSVPTAALFLCFFLTFVVSLLFSSGYGYDSEGAIFAEKYKYLHNFAAMPAVTAVFLVGVTIVLVGIVLGARRSRLAVWFSGSGSILAVLGLLLCAGWNGTCYYPSLSDPASSLTIADSSSSEFTLRVMSWVTLFIPVVVAYIWYSWRALTVPISARDVDSCGH